MKEFVSAQALGGSADAVASDLADQLRSGGGHTVGFLYVTSPLASRLDEIVTKLRRATGIGAWVGTVGHGVCVNDHEHWGTSAAVALSCRFAEGSFQVLPPMIDATQATDRTGPRIAASLGIVHGDPRNGQLTDVVSALSRDSGAFLIGGLTSADGSFPQVAGNRVVDGGVSGILLGGHLHLTVGLTQGCSPIGPVHVVTRCEGQIAATLDRQRAYDVMCEDVGIAERADPRPWLANVHAALPVGSSNDADYLVRNLIGIDARQGLVAIAANLKVGDRIMFVRRDAESAAKDLSRMLADLEARVVVPPKAALYYSCVARGPNLFERESHEARAIRDTFGEIPLAGFFGNGEISNDRIYGYTGVLALFS